MPGKKILVTGGAGYIGSHTCVELLEAGFAVVVVDNLSNSFEESLNRVRKITGKDLEFNNCDLRNEEKLNDVFVRHPDVSAVIHFAGLKAVGESWSMPLEYYSNNLDSTLVLLKVMKAHNCFNLVFSSSATVYGDPQFLPLTEEHSLNAVNPYGRTKLFIEEILRDLCHSDKRWTTVLLRYFNPTGAHKSGTIGEHPQGIPNNLCPYITQVAIGIRPELNVFGNDYDTVDGTGVRDYIHVTDLALGHVAALKRVESGPCGAPIYNLGTGTGYSVLQMVEAFKKASGKPIPVKICPRRDGDCGAVYADPKKAREELDWSCTRGLDAMIADSWRWQHDNPKGFERRLSHSEIRTS